jgi:hypothetical protein
MYVQYWAGSAAVLMLLSTVSARSPSSAPRDPLIRPSVSRVTVQVTVTPASVRPGEPFQVHAEVIPQRGIHVYAPGNRDYLPVTLSLNWPRSLRVEEPRYPPGEPFIFGTLKEIVNVYQHPFRITQQVTIPRQASMARSRSLDVGGVFRYQACDDRICFPIESVPLQVTIPILTAGQRTPVK